MRKKSRNQPSDGLSSRKTPASAPDEHGRSNELQRESRPDAYILPVSGQQYAAITELVFEDPIQNQDYIVDSGTDNGFLGEQERELLSKNTAVEGLPDEGAGERIKPKEDSVRAALEGEGLSKDVIDDMIAAVPREQFEAAASGLPTKLPEPGEISLYAEREDRSVDAVQFYESFWRPYELAGLLYQHMLRERDPKLIAGIRTLCHQRSLDPAQHLPPTKSAAIDAEIAATGLSEKDIHRYARHLARKAAKKASENSDERPEPN